MSKAEENPLKFKIQRKFMGSVTTGQVIDFLVQAPVTAELTIVKLEEGQRDPVTVGYIFDAIWTVAY